MFLRVKFFLLIALTVIFSSSILYSAQYGNSDEQGMADSFIRDISESDEDRAEPEPVPFHFLPKAEMGYVDWVKAMDNKNIDPLTSIKGKKREDDNIIDLDIIFQVSSMENVKFSHKSHTVWLDCSACHPSLFQMQKGATPVSMKKIQQGDYCGRCHGIVAFPLFDCERCHSYFR